MKEIKCYIFILVSFFISFMISNIIFQGHQSSSSIEFSNRNSIINVSSNGVPKRESDTEKILDTLEERDETPTTSDSMA